MSLTSEQVVAIVRGRIFDELLQGKSSVSVTRDEFVELLSGKVIEIKDGVWRDRVYGSQVKLRADR